MGLLPSVMLRLLRSVLLKLSIHMDLNIITGIQSA